MDIVTLVICFMTSGAILGATGQWVFQESKVYNMNTEPKYCQVQLCYETATHLAAIQGTGSASKKQLTISILVCERHRSEFQHTERLK